MQTAENQAVLLIVLPRNGEDRNEGREKADYVNDREDRGDDAEHTGAAGAITPDGGRKNERDDRQRQRDDTKDERKDDGKRLSEAVSKLVRRFLEAILKRAEIEELDCEGHSRNDRESRQGDENDRSSEVDDATCATLLRGGFGGDDVFIHTILLSGWLFSDLIIPHIGRVVNRIGKGTFFRARIYIDKEEKRRG